VAQVKIRFYLPLRDNDGRSLAVEIDDAERELSIYFTGWSNTGVVRGAYRMADQTLAFDELNAYELIADESEVAAVEAVLLAFKARTTQEAIYFEVVYNTNVRYL
jgi:hypothetical protein